MSKKSASKKLDIEAEAAVEEPVEEPVEEKVEAVEEPVKAKSVEPTPEPKTKSAKAKGTKAYKVKVREGHVEAMSGVAMSYCQHYRIAAEVTAETETGFTLHVGEHKEEDLKAFLHRHRYIEGVE